MAKKFGELISVIGSRTIRSNAKIGRRKKTKIKVKLYAILAANNLYALGFERKVGQKIQAPEGARIDQKRTVYGK